MTHRPTVAGLFAGIGGIELGLNNAGYETAGLCEIDESGRTVLRDRFNLPTNRLWRDVTQLKRLPKVDLVTAGFPCQDLSQAGRKSGIGGAQSGLVEHVFRLIDGGNVETVLLENVSYMLRLDKGGAMNFLVTEFEDRGYRWAYRVVDARSFGVPQRRQRVLFVASRSEDPSAVLHADDALVPEFDDRVGDIDLSSAYGFYWTEGKRGLGWTRDAVPTVKGGSRLGIPSPPAVWVPATGEVGTPLIEDAERLQGFTADWTIAAETEGNRKGARWHLVGNAVCVPMSEWVGRRLLEPGQVTAPVRPLKRAKWPIAARGGPGLQRESVDVSVRVADQPFSLVDYLSQPLKPLSARATRGFLKRAREGKLRFADGFLESLDEHLDSMESAEQPAA
ncbi:DNA cytosine methyltransferase [bacterium]|nr:DNA cytosine methyltransferase [bacterium]